MTTIGERSRPEPKEDPREQRVEQELSSSVRFVVENLSGATPAAAIVNGLLRLHPEYGKGSGGSFQVVEKPDLARRPTSEWLREVRSLFDPTRIRVVHGRVMILGLA